MKSKGVTLQRTYLAKIAKRNIVRHPAKLSNILVQTENTKGSTKLKLLNESKRVDRLVQYKLNRIFF